ncbi:MAG: FG-GAP repeat protein [Acidobacteria bacterium]|nr:FG-GAP repeat protein [Acidobacteriota bacterium]
MRARTLTVSLCLLTLCACAAAPEPAKEEQRAAAPQTNAATPPPTTAATPSTATAAPPAAQEARAAVERIYKGAVVFDGRASDAAAVGDFNGDGYEDIVVRARPAPGRLAEVNDEVANWIVSDPRDVTPPDPRQFNPHQGVQRLAPHARPRVEAADALLVVVHGHREAGWRNPEAQQTFLLKGVAGEELRPERRAEAQAAAREQRLRLVGDVLHEKLGGVQGFLYWTGAGYGWLGEGSRQ